MFIVDSSFNFFYYRGTLVTFSQFPSNWSEITVDVHVVSVQIFLHLLSFREEMFDA